MIQVTLKTQWHSLITNEYKLKTSCTNGIEITTLESITLSLISSQNIIHIDSANQVVLSNV